MAVNYNPNLGPDDPQGTCFFGDLVRIPSSGIGAGSTTTKVDYAEGNVGAAFTTGSYIWFTDGDGVTRALGNASGEVDGYHLYRKNTG